MGKLASDFLSKYGFDGVNFVKQAGNEYFGMSKSLGLDSILTGYAEKINLTLPMDTKGFYKILSDSFKSDLLEVMAEAGEKFPENQKITIPYFGNIVIPPINPSIPKSKGLLQDFKNIVSDDDLRPAMMGVFVSTDGFLIGTDAHKLIKYKNNSFDDYRDKIIDLKVYIGTKGGKIDFIDAKYPNYEAIIPRNNHYEVKDLPLYPFYNLAKSTINVKKLQSSDVFKINLKEKGVNFSLNPIIFAELLEFALAKGFTKANLEFNSAIRAFLFKFDDGSEGIIMPIYVSADSEDEMGTKVYTFDEVISEFTDSSKQKATATKKAPTTQRSQKSQSQEPFRKFEGDFKADSVYISRRDIDQVILKSGEVLYSNDIVDGVYRVKTKKMSMGGVAQSYSSPMIESGMQTVTGNWGGSPVSVFAEGGEVKYDSLESVRKDAKQISKSRKGNFYILETQKTNLSNGENYREYTWGEEEDVNHIKGISNKIGGTNSIKIVSRYSNGELVSAEEELIYKNDVKQGKYAKGGKPKVNLSKKVKYTKK